MIRDDQEIDLLMMNEVDQEIQQLRAELRKVREGLRWALQEMIDDRISSDSDGTPDHYCEFVHQPDKGACDFHEKFWNTYYLAWENECEGPLAPCDKCEGPCPKDPEER